MPTCPKDCHFFVFYLLACGNMSFKKNMRQNMKRRNSYVIGNSGGWQVKNKELLQLEAPENFLAGGAKFLKDTFLVEKVLLTNANFKRRYNRENVY